MTQKQKDDHMKKFRSYIPGKGSAYKMPKAVPGKGSKKPRNRNRTPPEVASSPDHPEIVPKLKFAMTDSGSLTVEPQVIENRTVRFEDPDQDENATYHLYMKDEKKSLSRCFGQCQDRIAHSDLLVIEIKCIRHYTNSRELIKAGTSFAHFNCLKKVIMRLTNVKHQKYPGHLLKIKPEEKEKMLTHLKRDEIEALRAHGIPI